MASLQGDGSRVSLVEAIQDELASLRSQLQHHDGRVARAEADGAESERIEGEYDAKQQHQTLDAIGKFLQRIAYACNETRLLGVATMVVQDLAERADGDFARSYRREQAYEESRRHFREYWDAHKRACSNYLEDECVQLDTSKYRALIEERIADVTPEQLAYMHRYFDEPSALKLIAFRVRDRLGNKDRRLPTREQYKAELDKELTAFHRRAGQYLSERLPSVAK